MQTLALLLEGLEVQVLLGELLLESNDLVRRLDGGVLVAVEGANALLEADNVLDHHIGAVEDQREEQGEAAEVHVALGVKLAGLDLGALVAEDDAVGRNQVSFGGGLLGLRATYVPPPLAACSMLSASSIWTR